MKTSDISTFEVVSTSIARDDKFVFIGEKILTDADPKTFTFEQSYGKDKNSVFWLALSKPAKVEGADPKTFREVNSEDDSFDGVDKFGQYKLGQRLK